MNAGIFTGVKTLVSLKKPGAKHNLNKFNIKV
jgi:hypothetical protein